MFWMMNDMGPHGRGMRQGGTCRTGGRGGRGGLSVFPGALIGIFGALIALNVAGTVIAAVFAGIGAALAWAVRGFGSLFTGLASGGAFAASVAVGAALYFIIRRLKNGQAHTEEE